MERIAQPEREWFETDARVPADSAQTGERCRFFAGIDARLA
jgi:hypothetical protein